MTTETSTRSSGLFFALVVVVLSGGNAENNDCRQLTFGQHFIGKRLTNHLIQSFEGINCEMCEIQCFLQEKCVSYNCGKNTCDLNSSDHVLHPDHLVSSEGMVYHASQNACWENKCPKNATCLNGYTEKGYKCLCQPGYRGENCDQDADECKHNEHNCSLDASCRNTIGSFECHCKSGYQGDGVQCSDVDECRNDMHNCPPNASCRNYLGSFQCECPPGYEGDGVNCTDVDECKEDKHNCSLDASCHNTIGSFECHCESGYQGDGQQCTDVNECEVNEHNCSSRADCRNLIGSFNCTCKAGYQRNGSLCARHVHIKIRSEGMNDPTRTGKHVKSLIVVDGTDYSKHKRGFNIVVLHTNATVHSAVYFDTHGDQSAGAKMRDYINALPRGRIVLVATQDTAERLAHDALEALESVGAPKSLSLGFRSSWYLVGYKGDPRPDWVTQSYAERYQGPSEVEMEIVTDVGALHALVS